MTSGELPIVPQADSLDDIQWFFERSHRRFRLRRGWAVRRRADDVFLRTPFSGARIYPDDSEACAERIWWESAWPELAPRERHKLLKAARRSTKTLRTTAAPAQSAAPPGDCIPRIPIVTTGGARK